MSGSPRGRPSSSPNGYIVGPDPPAPSTWSRSFRGRLSGGYTPSRVELGVGAVASLVFYWALFWSTTRSSAGTSLEAFGFILGHPSTGAWPLIGVGVFVVSAGLGVLACIAVARTPGVAAGWVAALAAWFTLFVVFAFAMEYYTLGTKAHWSKALTHVDALYVAVGTLTTAGTGNINAEGDKARLLLTGQMLADILVVTVLGAIVVHRFTRKSAPS
jgi:hypothetical protein